MAKVLKVQIILDIAFQPSLQPSTFAIIINKLVAYRFLKVIPSKTYELRCQQLYKSKVLRLYPL